MNSQDGVFSALADVSRRDFMKLCTALAATMGLNAKAGAEMTEAMTSPTRPPVLWIGAQECTGCTESLLRATHPTIENLVLDLISLEYHEVLSAAFGEQAEENKHNAIKKYYGKYVLVVDGSIPLKDGGVYCMVAGKPIVEHIREAAKGAAAIIAIGSCASWGGVPSSGGNPTGAASLSEVLPAGTPIINIPGCPPNPHNFLATVTYIITYKKLPAMDKLNRPLFAYDRLIHENCYRRPHFDAGRFAKEFGDYGHRHGWCLYHLGCKGPETYGNCSTLEFCDLGSNNWPVGIGHPCYGCNDKGIGFTKGIFQLANVENPTPRVNKPDVNNVEGEGASMTAIGLLGAAAAVLAGVSVLTLKELSKQHKANRGAAKQASHQDQSGN